ncbi:MAG TPA: hypothetical protein VLH60_02020, partial [Sedimentisphaerales bacterium]|nr:hypothetical protein [Sedimentisphaerales bacterium]
VAGEPLKNAPPSLAFATVAMGAFRGLVVNVLWIRADRLKMEGQYFDAKQLAEWITTLQPRFAEVWDFKAWNMAYNISVAMPNTRPEERWRWVMGGIELLRDRGIPLNPHSIGLYRSLAWIFHHKIGGITDDVHRFYKLQMYMSMDPIVGDATNETFAGLIKAPAALEELLEDPAVAQLVTDLRAVEKEFEDDFPMTYMRLRLAAEDRNSVSHIFDAYAQTEALEKLDLFVKAYFLRTTWKMDPAFMDELNRIYGPRDLQDPNVIYPLDWRHPQVHAIYWAAKGLKMGGQETYSAHEINTDRIVFHALQALYRSGRMVIFPVEGGKAYSVFEMPDLRMYETARQAYVDALAKYEEMPGSHARTMRGLGVGFRNFLVNSAFSFYKTGHVRQAQRIFADLQQQFPEEEQHRVNFGTFVRNRMIAEMEAGGMDATNAIEAIVGFLREAYMRYAIRDDDAAAGLESLAREAYEFYVERYGDEQLEIPGITGRLDIPDFRTIRYLAIMMFIQDEAWHPDVRRALLTRIEIERPDLMKDLDAIHQQLQREQQEREAMQETR